MEAPAVGRNAQHLERFAKSEIQIALALLREPGKHLDQPTRATEQGGDDA